MKKAQLVQVSGAEARLQAMLAGKEKAKTPRGEKVRVENLDKIVVSLRRQAELEGRQATATSEEQMRSAYVAHNTLQPSQEQIARIAERMGRDYLKLNDEYYCEIVKSGISVRGYGNNVALYLTSGQVKGFAQAVARFAK